LKVIHSIPKGSLADWAKACRWWTKGKDGEPDQPYKSLVSRVLKRLKDDKLVYPK
jgi:hypothetical protein